MHFIHPNDIERYCMRFLLLNYPEATSFANLRTYNNVSYATFHEAAIALQLLENDKEWELCLKEASLTCTSIDYLRQLFVSILFLNHHIDM